MDGIKFYFQVDDPTGNSFVENPVAPQVDPKLKMKLYERLAEQNAELGLQDHNSEESRLSSGVEGSTNEEKQDGTDDKGEDLSQEVMVFNALCDKCSRPTTTNMKLTRIPYFKVQNFCHMFY